VDSTIHEPSDHVDVISREPQLDQFVLGLLSMVSLKEKFSTFGGASCAEPLLQLASNLCQASVGKSLYDSHGFSKSSELQFHDNSSLAAIELLQRIEAGFVGHVSSSIVIRLLGISGFLRQIPPITIVGPRRQAQPD
jgi:hypothetical protein